MDNIIQIERLLYAKICGERRLFHDITNNCPGKCENLKPQRSLCTLHVFCFIFRSSPSYVNCAACCLWNFEADIFWNIFYWLLYLKAANRGDL